MIATGKPRFNVPGIVNYFGGKGGPGTVRRIVGMMPPHCVYIEPFLGSGRILRTKSPAPVENVGIERDRAVASLWASAVPEGYTVICADALRTLPAIVQGFIASGTAPDAILVYCDPPYIISTRRCRSVMYRHDFTDQDHIAFLAMVRALPCRVMISHLPCTPYAGALSEWHTFTFTNGTRQGAQLEQVWCNFEPTAERHDPAYIGQDFRERERFKRQAGILKRRFDALPGEARIAFLAMLQEAERTNGPLSGAARTVVR